MFGAWQWATVAIAATRIVSGSQTCTCTVPFSVYGNTPNAVQLSPSFTQTVRSPQ